MLSFKFVKPDEDIAMPNETVDDCKVQQVRCNDTQFCGPREPGWRGEGSVVVNISRETDIDIYWEAYVLNTDFVTGIEVDGEMYWKPPEPLSVQLKKPLCTNQIVELKFLFETIYETNYCYLHKLTVHDSNTEDFFAVNSTINYFSEPTHERPNRHKVEWLKDQFMIKR